MSDQKSFELQDLEYDLDTYYGRMCALFESSSVIYAFVSNKEALRQYEMVKQQRQREQAAFEQTGSRKTLLTV